MSRAVSRRRTGLAHTVEIDGHELIVDEPVEDGGADEGPRPTRMIAVALSACTATTIAMYADRKEWDIEGLEVAVEFDGTPPRGEPAMFAVEVKIPDGLDDEQRRRVMVVAGKCPVHRMLLGEIQIETREMGAAA